MVNPGSPQTMQAQQSAAPPMMSKGTMIGMMATLVIMLVVVQFRMQIGEVLNVGLQVIDFDGRWPVLTLVIAGLIMITLSTVIRGLLSNPVEQAKGQQMQSAFNKELRQARLENNLFKLKKLQEQQPAMMAKSMETSTQMMKLMPITMVVVIPIYAWVWYFLATTVPSELLIVNLPWGDVDIMGTVVFLPVWMIIYTMISLPIGQLETKIVRFYLLSKRLKEMNSPESG